MFAAVLLLISLNVRFLGEETRGRTLEDTSGTHYHTAPPQGKGHTILSLLLGAEKADACALFGEETGAGAPHPRRCPVTTTTCSGTPYALSMRAL